MSLQLVPLKFQAPKHLSHLPRSYESGARLLKAILQRVQHHLQLPLPINLLRLLVSLLHLPPPQPPQIRPTAVKAKAKRGPTPRPQAEENVQPEPAWVLQDDFLAGEIQCQQALRSSVGNFAQRQLWPLCADLCVLEPRSCRSESQKGRFLDSNLLFHSEEHRRRHFFCC